MNLIDNNNVYNILIYLKTSLLDSDYNFIPEKIRLNSMNTIKVKHITTNI